MEIEQIQIGIVSSIATTIILFFVSVILKPLRTNILYETLEYDLEFDNDFGSCKWDIQWELERIKVEVTDVHNDGLEGLRIVWNRSQSWSPETENKMLSVSSEFVKPKGWPVAFRVRSIIRTRPDNQVNEYQILFDIRKRRSWFNSL